MCDPFPKSKQLSNPMMTSFLPSKATYVLVAGLALSILPSQAASVPGFVDGDIFVAFRATAAPGGSNTYIVKLGNDATSFGSTNALTLGNLGADLSFEDPEPLTNRGFGPDWSTRADLSWGVFGVRAPAGNPILYVSRARSSPSTPATPWPTLTLTRRQNTASQVNSVIQSTTGGFGSSPSYVQLTATANSAVAGFQVNGSGSSSYNFQVTNGSTDFGSTSLWTGIEGSFAAGPAETVLDIFRIAPEGVSLFGTLSISASGVITYTKPSTTPVDHDGDGYTDADEALAGTSDSNPSDFFRVSSLTNSAGNTVINFNSIASRSYKIYYSEDLAAGSWQLIDTVTTGPYTDIDPVRTARKKGFYKVAVTNP